MTDAELQAYFDYSAPTSATRADYTTLRTQAKALSVTIAKLAGASPHKRAALTHLRKAILSTEEAVSR